MPAPSPQAEFWANLRELCGRTVEGRMTAGDPVLDADFAAGPLIMGPVACLRDEVAIPFKVGADDSRTWVIARHQDHLRLTHVHVHKKVEDALSRYGGRTLEQGTATRQEFPADEFSKALFLRENRPQSVTNVWAVEAAPGRLYAYELKRPNRFVRVEFDLAAPPR
jgi:hypothetical protein